ncbi:MAG TPA: DUF5655 domain-containing protein [Candidatus Sulfopaludibacter sp.]|jgi:hypothetical protein|nr:DUF5655 domain-containing protein [Candidatus Sulfopaludibacter sp.]
MTKFELYSDKPVISFNSHLEGLDENTGNLFINLRDFIKSLGDDVIEEIRPHRIVYAKSLTFRYFLDIRPRKDSIILSIRKSRKEPAIEYIIRGNQKIDNIKFEISEAYTKI